MGSILVVDDEAGMRIAIKEALSRKGHSVEVAVDGNEAIRKIGSTEYEMVISDMKMPGPGGMEVLREVKKTSPHVPVLLQPPSARYRRRWRRSRKARSTSS